MAHSDRFEYDDYDSDDEREDEGDGHSGSLAPLDTGWMALIQRAEGRGITSVHQAVRPREDDGGPRPPYPGAPESGMPGMPGMPGAHPNALPDPFARDPREDEPADDIELRMTTPLEDPPWNPQKISPLFEQRYREPSRPIDRQTVPPNAPHAANRPSPAEENGSMYARRRVEDSFNAALQQRRAEDERMTGRRWPGNGIAYPGSAQEAMFFDQLAIAIGEVDPQMLARESALRYVRSSRVRAEDDLTATDIYAILYFGLGLTLRPLDCTGLPHVLAVYHRATREIYLDWKLLQEPPYGRAVLDPSAWRRAVDGSLLARLLLAWCGGVHLSDNYDVPLVLGFSPQAAPTIPHPPAGGMAPPAAPALSPDTLNRYRKAMVATATLLAPPERLWQQIMALRLPIRMGDPDWRVHMRAEYGYHAGYQAAGGPGPKGSADPVEQLVAVLAERNNCPPALIEAQLDGTVAQLDWGMWSVQLLREIPTLQMRYAAASQMFHHNLANQAPAWGAPGRAPEVQPIYVQLSL